MNSAGQTQGLELGLGGLEFYGPKDYGRLLLRRKWVIICVTFALALLTAVGAHYWPDSYKADSVIVVDPGKVPQTYVRSTATIPAADRLALLQAQILSDTRLSQIIDEMNLYSDLKNKTTPDQILLQMRKDIEVQPVAFENLQKVANPMRAGLEAFTVSFVSRNPSTAAQVSNRLASLFIQENMKARQDEVMGTAEFFDRELAKAKEDLQVKGKRLEMLRARYAAVLPESQNAHVQAISSLQMELSSEMDAITKDQQQKAALQGQLAESPTIVDLDAQATGGANTVSPEQMQIARLQSAIDRLRSRYGPNYPDVLRLEEAIKELKAQVKPAQKAAAPTTPQAAPVGHHNPVLESQIAGLDQDLQKHEERERELQSQIAFHQSKLQAAPAGQQELAEAEREYDNAEGNYKDIQARKFAADMSSEVEIRQKGERFVIVQSAQPPTRPYSPNRLLIDGMALPAGLGIAMFLAIVLEVIDGTLKTEREVKSTVQAPIVAEIPWLPTPLDTRRQRLRAMLAAGSSSLLALAYLAAVAISLK